MTKISTILYIIAMITGIFSISCNLSGTTIIDKNINFALSIIPMLIWFMGYALEERS
jgi:hypothetical protein